MVRKMDKIQRIFGFDNELFSIRREKFRMKNANNPIYAIVSYFGTYFPAKLIIPPHRGRLNNAIFVKLRISLRKETKLVSDSILRIFADSRRLRDGENAITRCNGKYRRCVGSRQGRGTVTRLGVASVVGVGASAGFRVVLGSNEVTRQRFTGAGVKPFRKGAAVLGSGRK